MKYWDVFFVEHLIYEFGAPNPRQQLKPTDSRDSVTCLPKKTRILTTSAFRQDYEWSTKGNGLAGTLINGVWRTHPYR